MTNEQPEYKRAIQIIVYDLQGGPFPEKAVNRLLREVEEVAQNYNGLAISVIQE